MENLSVLILDDEIEKVELLKDNIERYIKSVANIFVNTDVDAAVLSYLENKPHILILDIELGHGITSFDFLARIPKDEFEIIFVTSHKDYAIKALNEVNATAYLVKPYKAEELVAALSKAIKKLSKKIVTENRSSTSSDIKFDSIAISLPGKVEIIKQKDIVYLEANGRFTNIYLKNGAKHLSSKNVGVYEELLDNTSFFRIHHKYVVNINEVVTIEKGESSYCEFLHHDKLPISKRKLAELYQFINLKKRKN